VRLNLARPVFSNKYFEFQIHTVANLIRSQKSRILFTEYKVDLRFVCTESWVVARRGGWQSVVSFGTWRGRRCSEAWSKRQVRPGSHVHARKREMGTTSYASTARSPYRIACVSISTLVYWIRISYIWISQKKLMDENVNNNTWKILLKETIPWKIESDWVYISN
jgi:hypothetical protein